MNKLSKYFKKKISEWLLQDIKDKLYELDQESYNRRFYAIEQTADYLVGARIPGDYCEFGVYKGNTFVHAYNWFSSFKSMKFYAFDSFRGLPEPKGLDAKDGFTSSFQKGDFTYSEKDFKKNLRLGNVNMKRVTVIPGWFKDTLKQNKINQFGLKKIAVAWIDCDLYQSAVPVLNFITPYLSPGTVLIFDDWRCFRNNPNFGVQKAYREWLKNNPEIKLNELFSFGWHGLALTVVTC